MSNKFVMTLGDTDTIDLVFDVYTNDISTRWKHEIEQDYPLFETERFKAWPNDGKDLVYYSQKINEQIDIVNMYYPNSIDSVDITDQNALNYLHKHFENMRGELEEKTEFFKAAPIEIQTAIMNFNVYIHECEHFMRHSNYPEMVCTYSDRPRYELLELDYDLFTFKWKFGVVYINYCEVGKPLLDVFKDQDEIVGIDNIRPLKYYSADFMIKFGPDTPEEVYQYRLQKFNEWYATQNFNFPHTSLGAIPVAELNYVDSGLEGMSRIDIVRYISNYLKVKRTCIR